MIFLDGHKIFRLSGIYLRSRLWPRRSRPRSCLAGRRRSNRGLRYLARWRLGQARPPDAAGADSLTTLEGRAVRYRPMRFSLLRRFARWIPGTDGAMPGSMRWRRPYAEDGPRADADSICRAGGWLLRFRFHYQSQISLRALMLAADGGRRDCRRDFAFQGCFVMAGMRWAFVYASPCCFRQLR